MARNRRMLQKLFPKTLFMIKKNYMKKIFN